MEVVVPAALEGGAEVGSTVWCAVGDGLSGSSLLPEVVLEGEGEDVVVVEDVEVAAVGRRCCWWWNKNEKRIGYERSFIVS